MRMAALSDGRPPKNRRRYDRVALEGVTLEVVRVAFVGKLPLWVTTPNPNVAVRLLDVGGGGFRMIGWASMNKGDRMIVKLTVQGWKTPLAARARVVRSTPIEMDGREYYEVASEFVDVDAEDRIRLMELRNRGKILPES